MNNKKIMNAVHNHMFINCDVSADKNIALSSMIKKNNDFAVANNMHGTLGLDSGPNSPTAASDDSSVSDIGNVDSLEVPDTPTSEDQNEESEDQFSSEWTHVYIPDEDESTVRETKDSSRVEELSYQEQTADLSTTNQNDSQDASDHVPICDFQELRRREQQEAVKESTNEPFDPLKMLRKGAVAALGGTMVGVGLVMIPLPTPFGVVVASSGMAVLGTEFESAKEVNDKVMAATKKHMDTAREHIIKNIEEMEGAGRPSTIDGPEEDDFNKEPRGNGEVMMNEAERIRQEEIVKQRNQVQPNIFDQWKRSTGAYLSRHLVPILKRSGSEVGSVPDGDFTVQSDTETLSEMDQTEDSVSYGDCAEADTNTPSVVSVANTTEREEVQTSDDKESISGRAIANDVFVSL